MFAPGCRLGFGFFQRRFCEGFDCSRLRECHLAGILLKFLEQKRDGLMVFAPHLISWQVNERTFLDFSKSA